MAQYQDEEENVRNLLSKEEVEKKQEFKYRSKYADKIKHDYKAVKVTAHPTMGYAKLALKPPSQYLKKHTRPLLIPQVDHHCLGRHSPRRIFPAAREHQSDKENKLRTNFVKTNVKRMSRMMPPERKENRVVDMPRGHTEKDKTPVYVFKKDFGKTPEYIIRRKHQLEQFQHKASQPDEKPLPFISISAQERLEILQGLKNYWSEVEREFQSLPLKIDTEPLKKRKSALEAKFKSLEKDIELLERHDNIYVMKE
ncbi:hypothetical protein WDU94_008045 [Cyamophila willieti]